MTNSPIGGTSDNNKEPPKETVGARLPPVLVNQLKAVSQIIGKTKTQIVNEAIEQYLQQYADYIPNDITAQQEKVALLNDKPIFDTDIKPHLNQRLDNKGAMVQAIITQLANIQTQSEVIEKVTYIQTRNVEEFAGGLTQTQLCDKYYIPPGSVTGRAKKLGITSQKYLEQETGYEYRVPPGRKIGFYYPPK